MKNLKVITRIIKTAFDFGDLLDVALFEIEDRFPANINPVQLSNYKPQLDDVFTICGWGCKRHVTRWDSPGSVPKCQTLTCVELTIQEPSSCFRYEKFNEKYEMCYYNKLEWEGIKKQGPRKVNII